VRVALPEGAQERGEVVHQQQIVPALGRTRQQTPEASSSEPSLSASKEIVRDPNVNQAFTPGP
jgi:hypothetical protein